MCLGGPTGRGAIRRRHQGNFQADQRSVAAATADRMVSGGALATDNPDSPATQRAFEGRWCCHQ
jgi:hypothetical protein